MVYNQLVERLRLRIDCNGQLLTEPLLLFKDSSQDNDRGIEMFHDLETAEGNFVGLAIVKCSRAESEGLQEKYKVRNEAKYTQKRAVSS